METLNIKIKKLHKNAVIPTKAHAVAKIPAIIADVPIEDYKIDNIIDRVVRPIIMNAK